MLEADINLSKDNKSAPEGGKIYLASGEAQPDSQNSGSGYGCQALPLLFFLYPWPGHSLIVINKLPCQLPSRRRMPVIPECALGSGLDLRKGEEIASRRSQITYTPCSLKSVRERTERAEGLGRLQTLSSSQTRCC